MKIRRGDLVRVIAGKNISKEGKVLSIDRKKERVIVEEVNMVKKHLKRGKGGSQNGGIIEKEAPVHVSNVMYLHKGKPTKIGYKVITTEKDGKTVKEKKRIAKSTGEVID